MNLQLATIEDFEFFYELKCEDYNVQWTGHAKPPTRDDLYYFYTKCLENYSKPNARRVYMIISDRDEKVGHVYIDHKTPGVCEFAIAIKQKYCGNGYARKALACAILEASSLGYFGCAQYVREDNVASIKAFEANEIFQTDEYIWRYIPSLFKEVKLFLFKKSF